jgi:cytochrome c oxidase cbb3-type subunit III
MKSSTARNIAAVVCVTFWLSSCQREERQLREPPPSFSAPENVEMSGLYPGTQPPSSDLSSDIPEEHRAYSVSEGKRLYESFNCVGCHSHGGGGIGPPLMDDQWIYGSQPANIMATIVEGRPNGMPSFRFRIPESQTRQIAAYVRSLSGQVAKDVAPGRSDDESGPPPESSRPNETPSGPDAHGEHQ